MVGHAGALPVAVPFATPDQRRSHDVVAVAVDIRPHLHRLSDNPLDGKAAAVDQRIDLFDMECAAGSGARDGLSCSVHGDAIDWRTRPGSFAGGDAPDIY